MLQPRHDDSPPYDEDYFQTLIIHNSFYENPREGIHFTHGTQGTIKNNIIIGKPVAADNKGIYIGQTKISDEDCDYECMSDSLDVLAPQVHATVLNNVIDHCRDNLVLWEPAYLTLFNNALTRADGGWAFQTKNGDTPDHLVADYNLLWGNDDEYKPVGLEGDHDINDSTPGGNNPRYQGWLNVGHTEYSYMLQVGNAGDVECDYPVGTRSKAIDAGNPDSDYDDVQPPGLDELDNDIGAYGGPDAVWDPTDSEPCLEYTSMPE